VRGYPPAPWRLATPTRSRDDRRHEGGSLSLANHNFEDYGKNRVTTPQIYGVWCFRTPAFEANAMPGGENENRGVIGDRPNFKLLRRIPLQFKNLGQNTPGAGSGTAGATARCPRQSCPRADQKTGKWGLTKLQAVRPGQGLEDEAPATPRRIGRVRQSKSRPLPRSSEGAARCSSRVERDSFG
jgi:hypothetical protein